MPAEVDVIKSLVAFVAGVDDAETKVKLYEAIDKIHELQDENRGLMEKLTDLSEQLRRRKALEYKDGGYYVQLEDGKFEGPICPKCYKGDGLIFRLKATADRELHCLVCKKSYPLDDKSEVSEPEMAASF